MQVIGVRADDTAAVPAGTHDDRGVDDVARRPQPAEGTRGTRIDAVERHEGDIRAGKELREARARKSHDVTLSHTLT